jgi:DNA polymerase III delta subunit
MIQFFTGDNSFEIDRAVHALSDSFQGEVQKIDGSELALRDLPDLLMSTTLFSDKRLVIIKDLSSNKTIWPLLPDWLDRVSDDVDLILIDEKPDKRTATYKVLKEAVHEFPAWTDRDTAKAETWLLQQDLKLDKKSAHRIVERVGVDQWQLSSALEKLRFLDEITEETIDETIDARPSENVFNLFETALRGNAAKVHQMIATLELTEDAYQIFALLASQAFQLAAIQAAGAGDNPAKDFGIHPFVVSKLSNYARNLSTKEIRAIIKAFADADADIKLSRAEPWLLVERALLVVATQK